MKSPIVLSIKPKTTHTTWDIPQGLVDFWGGGRPTERELGALLAAHPLRVRLGLSLVVLCRPLLECPPVLLLPLTKSV